MVDSGSSFLSQLSSSTAPLISDGAMGTLLNSRGVALDQCFDALNLSNPNLIMEIHRAYIEAGAQIIQTNTFGANRFKLAAYGLEDSVAQLNSLGVGLACGTVMAAYKDKGLLVAGDVGPLGVRLAPFGRVQAEQARQAFAEQIAALANSGADLLILETFSDLSEICEAIAAARQTCSLLVVASMTFTRDDRTLLGEDAAQVARKLAETGVDVIGINCSAGPAQVLRLLGQMQKAVPFRADGSPTCFSVMPNAGWPEQVGGRMMYPAQPEYFGEYALAFCEAGARLVGGCCGTTPTHIRAMRLALDAEAEGCTPAPEELLQAVEVEEGVASAERPSQLARKLDAGKFVIAVEMDPPRGLSTHKLIAGASLMAEAGADVISVADSPMAHMRMSPWAACELIQRMANVETTLHFPTRGRNLLRVQGDLLAAHALGVRNVFVVMGDPTAIGDYPGAMDNYDLVPSGLITLIKQNFNLGKDHAGTDIGQPTSFFVGCALNLTPRDPEREVKSLHRKLLAGADFILSQPVYQSAEARLFLKRYEDQYGPVEVPLLVGILPLISPRHASFLNNEVPGIHISESILSSLQAAGDTAPREGVRIALKLIEEMKPWASGIYLMPQFNRYDLAAEIIDGCRLL